LNAVKVSVADVRVEHAVKMVDFKKLAGQAWRIAARSRSASADSRHPRHPGLKVILGSCAVRLFGFGAIVPEGPTIVGQ
jgi:hypothetical protein